MFEVNYLLKIIFVLFNELYSIMFYFIDLIILFFMIGIIIEGIGFIFRIVRILFMFHMFLVFSWLI